MKYVHNQFGLAGAVREVQLTALSVANQERYYYFTVQIELPNGVDTQEVILDLDGKVIEPEVRRFDDPDEYYRYLDTIENPAK
jgi:hypothetical protein